jgi:hypothetical protein
MDLDIVHASFFSPTIYRKSIIFVPELKLQVLSSEMVCSLVEESCKYMLGLTVPALLNGTNHQFLGLAGIRSFDKILQQLIAKPNHESLSTVLNLSVDIISVGCSRYWFHKLIQTVQKELLPADTAANLQEQFTNLIQLWRTVGLRLGAGVHANQCNMMKQAASRLEQIYDQEYKIFNSLLDALPDHEGGII